MEADKARIYRHLEQKEYDRAEALLLAYCGEDSTDPEVFYLLGQVLGQMGRMVDAAAAFCKVIAMQPGSAVGHGSLGAVLRSMGRYSEAVDALQKACELLPGDEGYRLELVECLEQAGRRQDAFQECHKLLEDQPESGRGHYLLATLCQLTQQSKSAIENYRLSLKYAPELVIAHQGLGETYGAIGERALARRHFELHLEEQPDHIAAIAGLATLHERSGETDEAYEKVRRVADMGRYHSTIAHVYANICDRFDDCERAVGYAESALASLTENAREERKILHFALGRRYDKMGRYDKAFSHFELANSQFPVSYDPAAHTDQVTTIIQTFSPACMMSAPRACDQSPRPVFIVGMPRSGTSLVEQVLGSHPEVAAGGEMEDISDMLSGTGGIIESKGGYPRGVPKLTAAQLDVLAGSYHAHLHDISADAGRVTDKMPHNFMALGLIAQLFPGARVIHCRRDPLDTCLSIYFQSFLRLHDYASDLENIGTHYRQYLRLMQHWNNVLGIPMIEVEYCNMVDNLEAETRRLLDFCELEWDAGCLDFYSSKRVLHTASYDQVTQPVYRHSVERWRHYERHLEGLKAALQRD